MKLLALNNISFLILTFLSAVFFTAGINKGGANGTFYIIIATMSCIAIRILGIKEGKGGGKE
jgi:hypothetical protein